METPIRKYLKQKEYQRHKVLRRMKKRQQRKAELMLKIAEKLLKRKLPKMDGGIEPKIEYVDLVRINPITGEALMSDNTTGSVILPEISVRPEPKLTKSAFDGYTLYLNDLASFVPVAGDVNDGINAGIALRNGDYSQAALLGASLLLPNALEKPLRTVGKVLTPKFAKYLKHSGELKQLRRELDEMFRLVNELSQQLRNFEEELPPFPSLNSIQLSEDLQREMASVNYDRHFFLSPYTTELEIRRNIESLRNDQLINELTRYLRDGLERPRKNLKLPLLDSSKGDIRHLAYFNMSPRQAVAKMESDFLNLPSLRYFALVHDGDVSTDSYPLALSAMYKHKTEGDILPVFTEDGSQAMQRLNGFGNVKGDAAVDRINKKLSKIEHAINKLIPKAYLTEAGSIMVPSFLFKKYKHGKEPSIHINPANRGKFNALKRRTGKTTEQLTHSKNPLTRKRAIFALNSKKFKH